MSPAARLRRPVVRPTARILTLAIALLLVAGCGGGDQPDDADADTAALAEGADGGEAAAEEEAGDTASGSAGAAEEQASGDSIYQRPAQIELAVTGQEMYAGTYAATGTSRMCGFEPFAMPGQPPRFSFQFPYEGDFEIVDVNFNADSLSMGGSTKRYYIALALRNKRGGRPPNLVVRAGDARQADETGTASLAQQGDRTELRIQGRDERTQFTMTVRCGSRPKS